MNPPINPQNSQEALTQLSNFKATSKTPTDILAAQQQASGLSAAEDTVKGLRGAIANTTNLLKNVAPSIMGRTANSLVTNAQAGRQVANESAPLQETLGEQGRSYADATSDYDKSASRAAQAAGLEYQGQQDQQSYLQNLYNTLYGKEQDAAKQAEATRQFNEQLALEKQKAASSGGLNFNLGGGTPDTPTATPTGKTTAGTPIEAAAEGDVMKRLEANNPRDILSDYIETALSAKYGNQRDQAKVSYYSRALPSLINIWKTSPGFTDTLKSFSGLDSTRSSILRDLGLGRVGASSIISNSLGY